ncbi:MAG: sulfite exporter TauE/SafE family protein [Dehalococcoidia bacterium]
MSAGDIVVGIIAGVLGGAAGGFLGIGGGMIYVPALVLVIGEAQHVAQGVSLAVIITTAAVAGTTHLRQGNVELRTAAWAAPPAAAAAFGAAMLADFIDAAILRRIFAVVVLYVGVTTLLGTLRGERLQEEQRN